MKKRVAFFFIILVLSVIVAQGTRAQTTSNDDCLTCHSDSTLTMQVNGKTVSLYVSQKQFSSSVHGSAGLACVDCHQGFDANDVPHKQTTPNVDCNQCHDVHLHSPKGSEYHLAHSSLKCWDCHGTHGIQPAAKIQVVNKCISCHPAQNTFLTSAHRKATLGHKAFTCQTCHQKAHDVKTVASSLRGVEIDSLCSQCHQGIVGQINLGIHAKPFAEGRLTCVSCHTAHSAELSKQAISQNGCYKCHSNTKLFDGVKSENGTALTSLVQQYQHSIHAESLKKNGKGATCVDCHGSHTILPASDPSSPVSRSNIVATCGKCHADVKEHYLGSSHGLAYKKGLSVAPVCTDCHEEHSIESISNQNSPVSRQNEPKICLKCHLDNKTVLKMVGMSSAFFESLKHSVHFVALSKGDLRAATCSDCHGAHDMLPPGNPKSKVFRNNIPNTCGQAGCHENVAAKYFKGIHGQALQSGNNNAPVCTTCHGDHQILSPGNQESTVYSTNIAVSCSKCHSSVRLTERYGMPSDRVGSYMDSYHGLAVREGSTTAANCASCHGAHEILPSSNPLSSINKANLAKTCGRCHKGATIRFASTPIHVVPTSGREPLLYWLSQVYVVLIISIIGMMLLHNIVDFVAKSRRKLRGRRDGIYPARSGRKLYVRMTVGERIQHLLLLLSFLTLVLTGFMLKFPDSWWVTLVRDLAGNDFANLRGLIHRIAGSVMIADALYHIYYVTFTERGRQFMKDMAPKIQDAKDAAAAIKYNLGLSRERPLFGRFTYAEKAEYWALIWGTAVMAVTGLLMWFNTFSLGLITLLGMDAAILIHYYEAILASLAILVWHFYAVIFNPDIYPLNVSCITGTLSEEEMEEEHPLELEKLREAQKGEIVVQNGDENQK